MFTDRHPNYNRYRSLRGGMFVIEGTVGAGKSSLGKSLTKYLNDIGIETRFFTEFVNEDLLQQFISDMKKYAYPFQVILLQKRIETYRRAEEYTKTGGVAIIDRSLIGDMTFAKMHVDAGNISADEYQVYLKLIEKEKLPVPIACLFLQCDIMTAT